MLRPESRPHPAVVSDRELGITALLFLVVVLLTAVVVPGLA